MYFPFIIEAGMLYKAIPPLYSIPNGSKKRTYFIDQIDMVKYVQKSFLSNNTLLDANKNQIANKDITIFFLTNTDYVYYLEKVANTYAINPYLLEMVLYHYHNNKNSINMSKLQKEVKSVYRFMDVYNENNTVIVRGSIESSNLIIISDKFIYECREILNILEKNESLSFIFNDKKSTLYNIMKAYEKAMPSNVQRYKGLGEMPKEQLAESTVLPENRTLIRYTMDDAKETLNTIREYESDTKKILSLVGTVTRDDLVE